MTNAFGFRVSKPPVISYPLSKQQVEVLNKYLEDIWNMQNGRFQLDVVSSAKTSAENGEVWIVGGTMQFKSGGTVYTLTP